MNLSLPKLLILLASLTAVASAQESVPLEEAQKGARKLNEVLGTPSDAPFALEVDLDKPQALKAGGVALMVLPDRKLSIEAIDASSKTAVPVGQLWTLAASVAADGKPTAKDKLRLVTVSEGEKSRAVQLYYLAVNRTGAGPLELAIFAKDKDQPILRVPLQKTEDSTQSYPLTLSGRKQDEQTGLLTIHVLGKYTAEVPVMKSEE
ncbi:MAG: hypothetical protein QOE70_1016 [Chthoniobacter sp.]|jgi:hypothetical protein|nr:hypothetical protein [Chthoniobacter sp.]